MNWIGQQLIPRALRGAKSLQSPVEMTACPPKYRRYMSVKFDLCIVFASVRTSGR